MSSLGCKERNRKYDFKRETCSIHDTLFLLVFPEDLADYFLAQKFMSFTTSVLDSGLSAGRDISPDPLYSSLLFLQPVLLFVIHCAKIIASLKFQGPGGFHQKEHGKQAIPQLGTVSPEVSH